MKKLSRFALHVDADKEKEITRICRIEKKALDTATYMLYRNLGTSYEPSTEKVALGALGRCATCFESMFVLTREGYIGSANALLRQVYEFLIWAKIAVNTEGDENLQILHDAFYNFERSGKADKLKDLFSKISYQSDTLSVKYIRQTGMKMFNTYAFYTHASTYAQQCPVRTDAFYEQMIELYRAIAMWLLCYMEVIQEHFLRALHDDYQNQAGDDDSFIRTVAASYIFEQLQIQKSKLLKIYPSIVESPMYRCFLEASWKYDGGILDI